MRGVFAVSFICKVAVCVDVSGIICKDRGADREITAAISLYCTVKHRITRPKSFTHSVHLGRLFFRNLQIPGEAETSSISVSFSWDLHLFLHSLRCLQQQVTVQREKKRPCGRSQWRLCGTFGHRPASAAPLIVWHHDTLPRFLLSQSGPVHLFPRRLHAAPRWPFVFALSFSPSSGAMHECDAVGDADGEAEGRVQRTGETLLPGWAPLLHSLEALTQEREGQEWVCARAHATPADIPHTASRASQTDHKKMKDRLTCFKVLHPDSMMKMF